MKAIAFRLQPGQDLRIELDAFVTQHEIEAACILTCVGSLSKVALRLAGHSQATYYKDRFEIVSLTGTVSKNGSHCHIALANSTGQTLGGHLLAGCLIYTTAEIVLGILPNLSFQREHDATTGYKELKVYERSPYEGRYG
jgi:predicted DNA-binding protein with PD1-like motif